MQKDHYGILLESIDSKVQITMEAVLALNQKIDTKIDELRSELKQDIAVVDSKVLGVKRLDAVEEHLSNEITAVRNDLSAHRNDTELHRPAVRRRPLKRLS
ncbi:MAG: hypothetical protein WC156_00940 [Pedobacter sp.]